MNIEEQIKDYEKTINVLERAIQKGNFNDMKDFENYITSINQVQIRLDYLKNEKYE